MKKIALLSVFVLWLSPLAVNAIHFVPQVTVVIVKNTVGADGGFDFHLAGTEGFVENPDFNIQTANNTGSLTTFIDFPGSSGYFLTENLVPGWQLSSVSCTGTDPADTSIPTANGVQIFAPAFTKVTCTFTNSQAVAKAPVLIVPGLLGTKIDKGSETLWPDINRMLAPFSSDSFMDPLQFQANGTPLDTSLTLGPVLDTAGTMDYTHTLINDLVNDQGYSTSTNLSLFAYDWRDNDEKNAEDFLKPKVDDMATTSPSGKIDIIAHSQGGLLVKRLLYDHPEYAAKIEKIIFVGVPNLGAPFAAKALLYGDNMGVHFGPLHLSPSEIQKISQNMPSVYELLPSQEYFNHSSGYLGNSDPSQSLISGTSYNFSQTTQALKDLGENSDLIDQAQAFHSSFYDNMDFSTSSIQTYNIMGCQSGTVGQILAGKDGKYHLNYVAGDGTVPIFSASSIHGAQNFYSLNTGGIHGTMLTTDGIRQTIENILTAGNLPTNNITQDSSQCHYNGEQVSVHSPVDLEIYDENGNHVGPNPDGTFDFNIDGVEYDVLGHDKFAFLPAGHSYTIKLPATSAGSFNFDSSVLNEGQITSTAHYDSIPITASSTATMGLNFQNNQTIQLDVNGDGTTDKTFQPSAILDPSQSLDITPPISTSTLTGTMGQPGFYRSNVIIQIPAADPVIPGHEAETSGVLKTEYNLDNAGYADYATSSPIMVATSGSHSLKFFSIDRAGNLEAEQSGSFIIDRTAPEFSAWFNTETKDFAFAAADDASTSMVCAPNQCTATDTAGNITVLKFDKQVLPLNIKNLLIKSLSYNGQAASIDPNMLSIGYTLSSGNMANLSQTELIKNQQIFNIIFTQKQNQSTIIDWSKGSKPAISTMPSLKILQVSTDKGKLKPKIN